MHQDADQLSTPSQPVVGGSASSSAPGLQLQLQQPQQDLRVAVRAPVLQEPRQHAAQQPHGALGPLAVAAQPEQIVGGAAQQVAAGAAQMDLAHAGAQDAGRVALGLVAPIHRSLLPKPLGRVAAWAAGEPDHAARHDVVAVSFATT